MMILVTNNIVRDNKQQTENDAVSNEKYKPRKKRGRECMTETNEGEIQSRAINKTITRKSYTN